MGDGAVGVDKFTIYHPDGHPGYINLLEGFTDSLRHVRFHEFCIICVHEFFPADSDTTDRFIEKSNVTVQIRFKIIVFNTFNDRPIPLFAFVQAFLLFPMQRHVHGHRTAHDEVALVVPDG